MRVAIAYKRTGTRGILISEAWDTNELNLVGVKLIRGVKPSWYF